MKVSVPLLLRFGVKGWEEGGWGGGGGGEPFLKCSGFQLLRFGSEGA